MKRSHETRIKRLVVQHKLVIGRFRFSKRVERAQTLLECRFKVRLVCLWCFSLHRIADQLVSLAHNFLFFSKKKKIWIDVRSRRLDRRFSRRTTAAAGGICRRRWRVHRCEFECVWHCCAGARKPQRQSHWLWCIVVHCLTHTSNAAWNPLFFKSEQTFFFFSERRLGRLYWRLQFQQTKSKQRSKERW